MNSVSEQNQNGCVVVLPVGPKAVIENLRDTIASIIYYCEPTTHIAVFDDSGKGLGKQLSDGNSRVFSRETERAGKFRGWAEFWFKLSKFYAWLLDSNSFSLLLRIDDDNLIIGETPEKDARDFLANNPGVGLLGQYRNMPDGTPVDISWPRNETERELKWSFALSRPYRNALSKLRATSTLRRYVEKATSNGWALGEHVPGGGYFLSRSCMEKLSAAGYFGDSGIRGSELSEDHLMSIAVAAVGFRIADFAGKGQPIAYNLRGLPLGYAALREQNRKIVHSVRRSGGDDESAVRSHFRSLRT